LNLLELCPWVCPGCDMMELFFLGVPWVWQADGDRPGDRGHRRVHRPRGRRQAPGGRAQRRCSSRPRARATSPLTVVGVNAHKYSPDDTIISNASCTTTASRRLSKCWMRSSVSARGCPCHWTLRVGKDLLTYLPFSLRVQARTFLSACLPRGNKVLSSHVFSTA